MKKTPPKPTHEDLIRLAVVKIREAILKGPKASDVSAADRPMIAFAACERHLWLPDATQTTRELWTMLDDVQQAAVLRYLSGE